MSRVVIGIGAEDRGDDAAGLEVVRRLGTVETAEVAAGSLDLIEIWAGADDVVVVDAMRSGAAPGTIVRFDGLTDPLPATSFVTTHALGPAEAIELARVLDRLPPRLTVIGIEAGSTDLGSGLSEAVAGSVEAVASEIDHA